MPEKGDNFQRLVCAGLTVLIGIIIASIGLSSQRDVSAEVAASGFAAALSGMIILISVANPVTPKWRCYCRCCYLWRLHCHYYWYLSHMVHK